MPCCRPNLSWFPLTLGVLSCATFIGSYAIAVYLGHVAPYFPYISNTGTTSPESCIFGQFINLSACLAFVCICIRYKLVNAFRENVGQSVHRLNKACLIIGTLSSLGLSIVANFQSTKIEPIHLTGAGLVFVLGTVYMLLQASMSFMMYPGRSGIYIAIIRLVIGLIGLISMTMAIITAIIAEEAWKNNPPKHSNLHWKPADPGFTPHVISTISEWIMAFSFVLYFCTYVKDFQKIKMKIDTHLFVQHLDDVPIFTDHHGHLETSGLLPGRF